MDKDHPRGMKIEDVAAYLSLTTSGVHDWVRRELIPGPIPGTHRWDKKAIDAALDKHSGLATHPSSAYDEWKAKQTGDGMTALERWKAKQAAK